MKGTNADLIANAKIVFVPIDDLKLDDENVRLKHIRMSSKLPTQDDIEKILRETGDVSELTKQILAANVVYEPLVINSEKTVIEGNRRLVALRLIAKEIREGKHPDLPIDKFTKVKCRALPSSVKKSDVDLYLATLHVRAKKPWKLFNRAIHVYQLNKIHHYSYNDIASYVGMSKQTIQRSIICYELVLDYSRKYPDDKYWFNKFSYYDELYKRKDLESFRNSEKNIDKFHSWIHDELFDDHRSIRQLPRVMMDSEAFRAFEKEGMKKALMILANNDPSINSKSFKNIKEAITTMQGLSRTELSEIKTNSAKMRYLYNLKAELDGLINDLENTKIEKYHR